MAQFDNFWQTCGHRG